MTRRCPVCRRILTQPGGDNLPYCRPCNTPVTFERDDRNHVLRAWNVAGAIVFQARASHRLDDSGPSRARADYASPLDAWTPTGAARVALVKPRGPVP